MSLWSVLAAIIRGVRPLTVLTESEAPLSNNSLTQSINVKEKRNVRIYSPSFLNSFVFKVNKSTLTIEASVHTIKHIYSFTQSTQYIIHHPVLNYTIHHSYSWCVITTLRPLANHYHMSCSCSFTVNFRAQIMLEHVWPFISNFISIKTVCVKCLLILLYTNKQYTKKKEI